MPKRKGASEGSRERMYFWNCSIARFLGFAYYWVSFQYFKMPRVFSMSPRVEACW